MFLFILTFVYVALINSALILRKLCFEGLKTLKITESQKFPMLGTFPLIIEIIGTLQRKDSGIIPVPIF